MSAYNKSAILKITLVIPIAVLMGIGLAGCENMVSCMLSKHIVVDTEVLPVGRNGHPYSATIQAGVDNSSFDDSYNYRFTINGLPRGLEYEQSGRSASITGTPKEAGSFMVEVDIYSNDLFNEHSQEEGLSCIEYKTFKALPLTIEL